MNVKNDHQAEQALGIIRIAHSSGLESGAIRFSFSSNGTSREITTYGIKFSVRIVSAQPNKPELNFLLIEFLAASLAAIQGEKKSVQMRGKHVKMPRML